MKAHFTAEFFKQNRTKLRELFTGTAPIVITANGVLQRNGDVTYPFRQDSSFWYLTGINEPDIVLVMDKTKEYLIVPGRSEARQAFDGAIDADSLQKASGIATIINDKEGWKLLGGRLKRVKHIATLAPAPTFVEAHGFYTNPARRALIRKIRQQSPNIEFLDLRTHLARLRSIKQPEELQAIQAAVNLTSQALRKVKRKLPSMSGEAAIEALIAYEFKTAGSSMAYAPIVANGKNACTLHYVRNNDQIDKRGLLLLDVGAEVNHYAADITRTYALVGPTKRQTAVYLAVLDVHSYALSLLKPGVMLKDYEQKVTQLMGEKLRELGLIKSIEKDEIRKFYPHSTSHFLGLDVHDAADYDAPLAENMVLTVEPGIYIPKEGIGIRIEDDVVITKQGARMLSASLPRQLI